MVTMFEILISFSIASAPSLVETMASLQVKDITISDNPVIRTQISALSTSASSVTSASSAVPIKQGLD